MLALALVGPLPALAADTLRASGSCREGQPHGAYELSRAAGGKVRAIGAFNHGRRTGSFIFWNDGGIRVAHIPYDDDAINGTVAIWYPSPVRDRATPQELEARYAAGRRNGLSRSWYGDSRLRSEAEYREGKLVGVAAWDARGHPLDEARARALVLREEDDADARIRAFEDVVRRHPPPCASPNGDGQRR